MRTSAGVHAAGDVTGKDQFVYMAAYGAAEERSEQAVVSKREGCRGPSAGIQSNVEGAPKEAAQSVLQAGRDGALS